MFRTFYQWLRDGCWWLHSHLKNYYIASRITRCLRAWPNIIHPKEEIVWTELKVSSYREIPHLFKKKWKWMIYQSIERLRSILKIDNSLLDPTWINRGFPWLRNATSRWRRRDDHCEKCAVTLVSGSIFSWLVIRWITLPRILWASERAT